jgi:hypothetical protein
MMRQLIAERECQLPADHAGQGLGDPALCVQSATFGKGG